MTQGITTISEHERAAAPTRPARIMMVDDDAVVRRMLLGVLGQKWSYQVAAFETGGEAWDFLAKGFVPDLFLLDIVMPEPGGLALLTKIRSVPALRHVPVIMCSVVDARPIVNKCLSLGASSYLTKPFTAKTVLDEVDRVLRPGGGSQSSR